MPEEPKLLGGKSAEEVAYELLGDILAVERRTRSYANIRDGQKLADRKYLLDTYLECIAAVKCTRVVTS